MTRRVRRAAAAFVVSSALAVGLPVGWLAAQPDATVGTSGLLVEADPPPSERAPYRPRRPDPPAATAPAVSPRFAGVTRSLARVGDVPATARAEPRRLRIPALGVEAPVVDVGVVAETGEMKVPGDASTVGWYRPGGAPGDRSGSAVLAGHVDTWDEGPGAFFHLQRLQPDDEVLVETSDGAVHRYVVAARERHRKEELPVRAVFDPQGPPRLVLLTCGGAFDTDAREYTDNVVVVALPA